MKKLSILLAFIVVPWVAHANEVTVTPTVTASVTNYTIGDCVGGVMTFTNLFGKVPNTGVINTVIVADQGKEGKDLWLILFPTLPTGTLADNGACTPSDASLVGARVIPLTTHYALADNGTVQATPNIWMSTGSGTVYGILVARGDTYFYDATNAVSVTLVGVADEQ